MRKKKKKAPCSAPLRVLLLLFLFCAALTYFWNLRYTPDLPNAEIPPFSVGEDTAHTDKTADAGSLTDDTAAVPAETKAPPAQEPPQNVTSSPPQTGTAPRTEADTVDSPKPDSSVQKRRRGVYNFLVAGKDAAAANTDVLILLSFDTENRTASAVQIPRDTYLDGYKINALWAKYSGAARRNGAADPTADGMERLCDTLEETLCIRIDHWVFCSLAAVRAVVDALGGVTLTVPCDMDYEDPAQNLSIHLKAGKQTLDGAEAEQFVRFRSGYLRGDLGRADAQKLFLSALLTQLKTISPLKLPALVAAAVKHVDMSLGINDILFFAGAAQKLDPQNVTFLTLPGTDCREWGSHGAWYYILSREGTWETVNAHLNVYEIPVDGKVFDRSYRFTDKDKPTLLSYYKTHLTPNGVTGADMTENGISIPTSP